MIKRIIVLFTVVVLSGSVTKTTAITINTADAKGIRYEEQYSIVNFLGVSTNSMYADRTLLEFDISDLSGTIPLTTLDLSFGNLDYPDPPDGIIDVFAYVGDGIVTANDFYAGGLTPFTSFVGENGPEYGYISIDVTSVTQTVVTAGNQFIGFRLSTETDDVFTVGWSIGVPDPVLTVIPEPGAIALLGLGALLLRRRRRV